MVRSRNYAVHQYGNVLKYLKSIGVNKPVHIGETGWLQMATLITVMRAQKQQTNINQHFITN